MEDLGSLSLDVGEGLIVPAAGAPWYMALFGRDALIAAYQAMLLGVVPAKNVLKALARYQAGQRDDFRDAEPGKISHELRRGELAFFGEVPQIPYHGTADATPLFLILPTKSGAGIARWGLSGRWRVRRAGRWAGSSTTPTGGGKTKNWLERFVWMPRLLGSASTGTSGWRTGTTTPSRSPVPGERWIPSPPTLIISSGATSFRRRRPGSLPTG